MNWWQRLIRKEFLEQTLSAELLDHFDRQVADNVRSGMSPQEARRQARLQFGGMEQVKEECRDARGTAWVEALHQDVRFSLRTLRKSPGFAIAAVATLAIGIGANAAMYSVVSGVLLKPLPYRDPDRLASILNNVDNPVSPADFLDLQKESRSFQHIGGAGGWSATLTGAGQPEEIIGLQVSEGTFDMLGIPPVVGRLFLPEESQPGKERVVILSYDLWQRRFGGDRNIVDRQVILSNISYTVVGVMPRGFQFTPFWITNAQIWLPLTLSDRSGDRGGRFIRAVGRLKPGVSAAQAQAEMSTIAARLSQAYPGTNAGLTIRVDLLKDKVVGSIRRPLIALMGAVAFVLLIACTNIANLTLARASERRKEIAIRLAMGAGRMRLFRQVFTESLLLAALGGTVGLAMAAWAVAAVRAFLRDGGDRFRSMPRVEEIQLDGSVLLGVAAIVVVAGFLLGLVPAFRIGRDSTGEALKDSSRGSSGSRGGLHMRSLLIVGELAISLVLLAGAGLLIRSFVQLRSISTGFVPHNLLSMNVSVAGQPQYLGPGREVFYRQVLEKVSALPGVRSASMVNHLPIGGDTWGTDVYAEGQPVPAPGKQINCIFRVARPNYFHTMGIPLLRGRDFSSHDNFDSPDVVVINQKLAHIFWPSGDAVGKRISLNHPFSEADSLLVIGVAQNVTQRSLTGETEPEVYLAFLQSKDFQNNPHHWMSYMTLVARTDGDPDGLAQPVQNAIWSLNKDVAISDVRSFDRILSTQLWQPRFEVGVLGFFAGFALLLAAVGTYGVMAYSVTLRTHEIGIRMALGAGQGKVLWMIVRHGAILALAGISVGTGLALVLTRFLAGMLFGVTPTDTVTFLAIPFVLAAVALLASLLPARRAAGVDPMLALRSE